MPATSLHLLDNRDERISYEVKELISYKPHWIIRKGNIFFLLILLLLMALTLLVKYPDIIQGSVRLTAINPPKLLAARIDGKLEKLLVINEQEVRQGQIMAFMQSIGKYEQVLLLQKWINQAEIFVMNDSLEILPAKPLPLLNELGELQSAYQDFQKSLNETLQILFNGYYQQKKKALQKDIRYLSYIEINAKEQQKLLEEDYSLQQTEYKANESLAKDKVIAPVELSHDRSKLIAKEEGLKQMSAQHINTDIAEHNKNKELLDLEKYITDQHHQFLYALFSLKSKVEEWIQKYAIVAPEAGKVLFTSFLQENQLLTTNQELFYVQPAGSKYYGELMASQSGLGKIKTGQKVLIRIESYPSNEFGWLAGTVNYISGIAGKQDSFLIKVDLPKGLQTNYNKTIFFRNNLLAKGEIITDNRKLFDRFLGQFRESMKW